MNNELVIEDIQLGDGKAVVKGALITTHYNGYLEDGSKFDSSYDRGKAFQCVIGSGRVIKGWDIGMLGMKVGGRRQLICPPALAYGPAGGGHRLSGRTLTFVIDLLGVK